MDKTNLDELFRKKFKDFRETPDEKVWTAIERSLDKKRKRRIIPLWWKLAGVAALLAIGLITFYPFENTNENLPTITDTENKEVDVKDNQKSDNENEGREKDKTKDGKKNVLQIPQTKENAVVDGSEKSDLKNTEDFNGLDSENSSIEDSNTKNSNTVTNEKQHPSKIKRNLGKSDPKNTQLTDKEGNKRKESSTNRQGIDKTERFKTPVQITETTDSLGTENMDAVVSSDKNKTKDTATTGANMKVADEDLIVTRENGGQKRNSQIKDTEEGNAREMHSKERDVNQISGNLEENVARNDAPVRDGNENIWQDTNREKMVRNDSTFRNDGAPETQKKSILEALEAQGEEEEVAETSGSRWSAGPSVAPVYFNAIGEGSPIDPGFSPNSKSGNTNLSYGISVAYAVTEKLSLRSGIHRAEYGYDTDNVVFSPTLTNSSNGRLQNIDYTDGSRNLALDTNISTSESADNAAQEFSSLNAVREGSVAQSFGYLEVPLELDYALIDRKFGVNLIGGISSLFLLDNSVTLNSDELTSEIGEASNLNNFNLSTNVGFGLNYKFTSKIRLNIEPVFKYQLNTFSNVSGDFRPFSIGVYSGLNFRF